MDYHFANVFYGGQFVGTVSWDIQRHQAAFEYHADFIKQGVELAPLHMPLRSAPYQFSNLHESFSGLPGMLADCLPDTYGNALIDEWLRTQGRSPQDFSPVERLCYIGQRGMGALEFQPAVRKNASKAELVDIDALVELASLALARKEGLSETLTDAHDLNEILRVGTSAGGARAKAVVAFNEKTHEVRSGQALAPKGFSHWLLKFDGVSTAFDGVRDPQGYGRIEYAYYLMATQAGIQMSECRLLEEGGRAHFMTRRFDRPDNGKRKTHFASLFGMAHMSYAAPGSHSHAYEDYFEVIESLELEPAAKLQAFRRMVFNVLACNRDDHSKNFGFVLNETEQWDLSPAYDVTYAHNPAPGKWTASQQMSVQGKRQEIGRSDLLQLGRQCDVATKPKLESVIEEVITALETWETFARKAGVFAQQTEQIGDTLQQQLRFS